jgi:hypothetical protein
MRAEVATELAASDTELVTRVLTRGSGDWTIGPAYRGKAL